MGRSRGMLNGMRRALLGGSLYAVLSSTGIAWSDDRRVETPIAQRSFIEVQDTGRNYFVHFPSGSRAAPWPLVLVLHGAGGDALETLAMYRWIEASDLNGFILVGLEARPPRLWFPVNFKLNPRIWNSGDPGVQQDSILKNDDVAYTRAVLDELAKRYTIDPNRVYATGFSSGGGMVQRLGVELSERFAAIAAVGSLRAQNVAPRNPLSVLLVYGRRDPVVPYEGGKGITPWGDRPDQPPVAANTAGWVRDLHCTGEAQTAQPNPQVLREAWKDCDGGNEVQAVTVNDLGHHWAGSLPDGLKESVAGPMSRSFDDTTEIWSFFAAHPRHGAKPQAAVAPADR